MRIPLYVAPVVETISTLEGDWDVQLGPRHHRGPLRLWPELGMSAYWGIATYRRHLTNLSGSSDVYLDLGQVRYAARVKLNGQDLGPRAWSPYRWRLVLR